jgi:hypothetical protein
MAAPVENLAMYYEDTTNYYTNSYVPLLPMTGVNKVANLAKASVAKVNDVAIASINILDKVFGKTLYYFHDEASDVAGYKKLTTSVSDIVKTTLGDSASAGDAFPVLKLLGSWITDAGVPGFTGILPASSTPNSPWILYLRQKRTVYVAGYISNFTIRWYRYYDDEDFGWTLSGQIAYVVSGSATLTEQTKTYQNGIISSTWGATDRLVCKIWANFDEMGLEV